MAITTAITGNAQLGEILSGWTVQESATPVAIGEFSGGTGSVSMSVGSKPTSLFAINEDIVTTHSVFGSIDGIVKTVSSSGLVTQINHSTALSKYDCERIIPAIYDSSVASAIEAANASLNVSEITANDEAPLSNYYFIGDNGTYWSCAGVFYGVDKNNAFVVPKAVSTTYGTNYFNTMNFNNLHVGTSNNFLYANDITGDSLLSTKTFDGQITYKTVLEGANHTFSFQAMPLVSTGGIRYYLNAIATIDYALKTLEIHGEYENNSHVNVPFSSTVSLAAFDLDVEIVVDFWAQTRLSKIEVAVRDSAFTTSAKASFSIPSANNLKPKYTTRYRILENARAIWRRTGWSSTGVEYEYGTPPTYLTPPVLTKPVPSVKMNVWEYLQAACSANSQELYVTNGVLSVRDIGSTVIDVSNTVGNMSLTPTTTSIGNFIDVVYQNATAVSGGVLYDARADGNKTFKVEAGQAVVITIETKSSPTTLFQPYHTETFVTGEGSYYVIAADNTPITASEWAAYGGKIEVAINKDSPNSIDIHLTGPVTAIPGKAGPYEIGISSDVGSALGALSILGIGVVTDKKTLHLATGSDHSKTTTETAKTIDNPFIANLEQAYDRGMWASIEACGPRLTLAGTIPASALEGFGLTPGALIRYFDSIYRIVDVTISNASASFTATRYVTVTDFDTLWNGIKVSGHDALWNGSTAKDQMIVPLYYVGNDETVIMLIDVDGVPYYDFSGDATISVFMDTDGNPYYENGGGLIGAYTVYLDTDGNPYPKED